LLEETSALSISEPLSPRTMIGSTVSVPGMEYRSLQTSTIPYHGDRGCQDTQDTRRREYTGSPSLEEPSSECSSSPPGLDHAQRKPSSQLRKSTNEMALPFQLNGHSRAACAVAFSPDGKFIASGSDDKTVRIWVIATGETLRELTGHSDAVWAVAFSMDGRLIASGSRDNTVWIWDTTTGKGLRS
jgi:WD40 repeat protein